MVSIIPADERQSGDSMPALIQGFHLLPLFPAMSAEKREVLDESPPDMLLQPDLLLGLKEYIVLCAISISNQV